MRRIAVVLLALLSACTGASVQQGAPASPPSGPPITFVTIGGDETFGTTLPRNTRFRDAWPQLVYRNALPTRATFTNLATPGATSTAALTTQLPIALQLHPTIVVVWLAGDAAAGISASTRQANLTELLTSLQNNGVERLIAVAGPDTAGGTPYNDATRAAVQGTNTTIVDLTELTGPLGPTTNHIAADAIAAAIGPVN